jgi:hypothetical protein
MSWGEEDRNESTFWDDIEKCYYCSELKDLTTLDKGTARDDVAKSFKERMDKRTVCCKCKKRVCFFCGEYKEREHISQQKEKGHTICYDCIISKIPESVVQYIESELMKKIHSLLDEREKK